ncbi:MAG: 50S ribosomal protein L9, partial [Zoogloea sp.]|nr:50S ribosomal protein L9 [Zoogloea sp.]
ADVADALKAKGFSVEKSAVRMPDGPLKIIGETQLVVSLHTDVTATINVAVVGES